MEIEIRPLDVDHAGDAVLREFHRLSMRSNEIDGVAEPNRDYEVFVGRLRSPQPGLGRAVRRAAFADGRLAAVLTVRFPEHENTHLVLGQLVVDPGQRCRGIGARMLTDLHAQAHDHGRTVIECWGVRGGGPGAPWARARGFRVAHAMQVQELPIDETDAAVWDRTPPSGYRLVRWAGHCPDEVVGSFAAARAAIADAPEGELDYRAPRWTAERVREAEAEMRDRGVEQRFVAAVHEPSGAVTAITELHLHPHRHDRVYQGDTAVLPAHRGRGLGVCVKAAMMRWLVADVPGARCVLTQTATNNTYMLAVNHAVGYRDRHVNLVLATGVR